MSLNDEQGEQPVLERLLSAFRRREEVLVRNWTYVGSAMIDGEDSLHGDAATRPREDYSAIRQFADEASRVSVQFSSDRDARVREYSKIISEMLRGKGIEIDAAEDAELQSRGASVERYP